MATDTDRQSFWEHFDVLRAAVMKSLLVAAVFGIVAFCFKEQLFAVILAPKDADFHFDARRAPFQGLVWNYGKQGRPCVVTVFFDKGYRFGHQFHSAPDRHRVVSGSARSTTKSIR